MAMSVEVLQGPWVMESSECTAVFEKIGRKVRFKDRNYALDSGFIISGRRRGGRLQSARSRKSRSKEIAFPLW